MSRKEGGKGEDGHVPRRQNTLAFRAAIGRAAADAGTLGGWDRNGEDGWRAEGRWPGGAIA